MKSKAALLLGLSLGLFASARPSYWEFHRQMDKNWEVSDEEVDDAIFSLPTHYAFSTFYIDSGGNDLNAGSVINSAALVNDAGGTYNQGTGAGGTDQYVASAGTPFSATVIGEYISVYTAGATIATFVGQITAINASGASVDISLTVIWGTRPANASTKTVKTGGSWLTMAPMNNANLSAVAAIGASTQINIQAATYAQTTNTRTYAWAGTATTTLWYRGYITTPGDLDAIPTATRTPGTSMPSVTFTTGRQANTGAQQMWTAISWVATGSPANNTVTASGANQRYHRCRFEAQSAASASNGAVSSSGANNRYTQCWLKATTTATQTINCTNPTEFYHCALEGGASCVAEGGALAMDQCTLANPATQCVLGTSATVASFNGNTFYNPSADAIKWTTLPSEAQIVNNLFHTVPGIAINNATGTNTNLVHVTSNGYYLTGTQTAGLGDSPQFDAVTDGTNPCPNAANLDFALLTSSTFYQKAAPQLFENQLSFSYASLGAVDPNVKLGPGGFFFAVKPS